MPGLKGNYVYAILFNHSDKDYSLIVIMSTLETAFQYICKEEKATFASTKEIRLVCVNNKNDIDFDYYDNYIMVCYVCSGEYSELDIWNRMDISQFIIVPMKVH
jgi:hypothetical protein